MQDISFSLVAVFLLFFTGTHSEELQSNDSTSTCKVRKVKMIPLQTEVRLRTYFRKWELILDEIHR